jgi:hypothetical protein
MSVMSPIDCEQLHIPVAWAVIVSSIRKKVAIITSHAESRVRGKHGK